MLEKIIAYHCAPALAGIKTANIVACYKDKTPNIQTEINRLNTEMNMKDIYFEILCECDKRALVMVYRKEKLRQYLQRDEVAVFLKSVGYPQEFSLKAYIDVLKKRLKNESFPHEIGAFLGYPLCDIYGFINHEPCLFSGYWKVYHNEQKTRELFTRYRICRNAVLKRLTNGRTLAQIFCAA